jgi:hypothetical protein
MNARAIILGLASVSRRCTGAPDQAQRRAADGDRSARIRSHRALPENPRHLRGRARSERRRNTIITDIGLAPRANGKVRYTSTFYILRPVTLANGNRKIFYDFGNRGGKRILEWFNDGHEAHDPTSAADFGQGFLMRHGYTVAWSGWASDVAANPRMMSIQVPIARMPTAVRSRHTLSPS